MKCCTPLAGALNIDTLPPGLEFKEELVKANSCHVEFTVSINTNHNIRQSVRTPLGEIYLVKSVTPVI